MSYALCPECGKEADVGYTYPASYWCIACNIELYDADCPDIQVLTPEEAKSKRPGIYGLKHCKICYHAPHITNLTPGSTCASGCDWCVREMNERERVPRLVKVQ